MEGGRPLRIGEQPSEFGQRSLDVRTQSASGKRNRAGGVDRTGLDVEFAQPDAAVLFHDCVARKGDGSVELVGEPRREDLSHGKDLECRLERRFGAIEAAGDRAADACAFDLQRVETDVFRGDGDGAVELKGRLHRPIELGICKAALADFDGRLQGTRPALQVERVAPCRQPDAAEPSLRQVHGRDIGGDIEDCRLPVADQRQVCGVDKRLQLAVFQRPAEIERPARTGEPCLEVVLAAAVDRAGDIERHGAGRNLACIDPDLARAVEGGRQVDPALPFEERPEGRWHQRGESAAAGYGKHVHSLGREHVLPVEPKDLASVERNRTRARPVGKRSLSGHGHVDGRFSRQAEQSRQKAGLRLRELGFKLQLVAGRVEDEIGGRARIRAVPFGGIEHESDAGIRRVDLASGSQEMILAGNLFAEHDFLEIEGIDLHVNRKGKRRAHFPGFGRGDRQPLDADRAGRNPARVEAKRE